jgi:DNA modification methylase
MGTKQDVVTEIFKSCKERGDFVLEKEQEIESAIIADKNKGLSDAEIGKKYGITYRQLEKIIRKATGVSVSVLKTEKRIKTLFPKDFKVETTTVWSFKSRGNWATHSGEYRGNWSPYIPRNVILKYSELGELVLDYFCGAGTTEVEAKLLGRRSIGLDINDKAIELSKINIDFEIPVKEPLFQKIYEPELRVGDARDLSLLKNNSVDLICAHPPYANIIHYTENKDGDLSHFDTEHFLKEMEKVAEESYRVLKPGRQCAILIGDMRRHKHVIPLGFKLINVYLNAGFKLKELIIKRQHNCKTTGFWYANSIKFNFLLLAHEYLPIFEKPVKEITEVKEQFAGYGLIQSWIKTPPIKRKLEEFETTTVWVFPEDKLEQLLNKNVIERYKDGGLYRTINLVSGAKKASGTAHKNPRGVNLLFIKSPCIDNENVSITDVALYLEQLKEVICKETQFINTGGYCVIQTRDVRISGHTEPLAKRVVDMLTLDSLWLKEIVVVTKENQNSYFNNEDGLLNIAHQYLLVYRIIK